MIRTRISVCTLLAVLCICFANVQAGMFDLTYFNAEESINGAIFQQVDAASTGTGLIQSFVRIQATGIEKGYNTDFRPVQYDELTSATFTHSLLLSSVPIVEVDGIEYREFLLDINQSKPNSLLSLDVLQIHTANTGNLSGHPTGWTDPVYDLGDDNWIKLDYSLNNGSGSGDMFAYIPDSLFDDAGDYVYLYSEFGASFGANAGPEEWAVRTTSGAIVPMPGAVLLGMLGLGVVGLKLRKFA